MLRALKEHWPEYFCEAAELGLFMISASLFTMLLWHPSSPVLNLIPNPFVRRMLTGMAMGGTAIALIFSPLGKRSGAHFNPAVTLTFWRLGKVKNWDAFFYVIAQFIGGISGVLVVALVARMALSHRAVNYVATLPGSHGMMAAFVAELVIAFILMTVVLTVSNTPHLARYTGIFAGCLVAIYITFEGPLSGMSMNPARTFAPAFVGHLWTAQWRSIRRSHFRKSRTSKFWANSTNTWRAFLARASALCACSLETNMSILLSISRRAADRFRWTRAATIFGFNTSRSLCATWTRRLRKFARSECSSSRLLRRRCRLRFRLRPALRRSTFAIRTNTISSSFIFRRVKAIHVGSKKRTSYSSALIIRHSGFPTRTPA